MSLKPTLLIVDDEVDLLEIVTEMVSVLKINVKTAANGEQALQMIKSVTPENPIDAVLSDINMPILNGLELLASVRNLGLETPFIFFTGYGDKHSVVTALRLGAMDFIDKPFSSEILLGALEKAIKYGMLIRNIEAELDHDNSFQNSVVAEHPSIRSAKKALLLLKKQNQLVRNREG
jgi:DNA-binding NtrC family response regulator